MVVVRLGIVQVVLIVLLVGHDSCRVGVIVVNFSGICNCCRGSIEIL